MWQARAMAESGTHRLLTEEAGFDPGPFHVGFVVDKVAREQVVLRSLPYWFLAIASAVYT
jgi:hypothetical protein